MCHAFGEDWGLLTRQERLMEMEAVRRHHAKLYRDYMREVPGGVAAYKAHKQAHREVAKRFAQARVAHVTHVAK